MIRGWKFRDRLLRGSVSKGRGGSHQHLRCTSYIHFNDVKVEVQESARLEKVPVGQAFPIESDFINRHLRWLAQKDSLGQDVFLLGSPGPLRRRVALYYAELTNREVEYLVITRDTTESDIKQRREIENGRTVYVDQSAVKAALNGSVLLVDGVEKAERNILPILNNLLENREMQLDDGRFLVAPQRYDQLLQKYSKEELKSKKLERVNENFRVIALGLPVPKFRGNPLDPPIRSRFQSRKITALPFNEMFELMSSQSEELSSTDVSAMLTYAQIINSPESSSLGVPHFPEMALTSLVKAQNHSGRNIDVNKLLFLVYPHKLLPKEVEKKVEDIVKKCVIPTEPESTNQKPRYREAANRAQNTSEGYVPNQKHEELLQDMSRSFAMGSDLCLVGPKSSGKSIVARHFAHLRGQQVETFMLYNDITARDILQQRSTKPNGDTFWNHSPLIDAALEGKIAILDGLHHVEQDTLPAIQSLVHDREVTLFDGAKLISKQKFELLQEKMNRDNQQLNRRGVFAIPEEFRILALAEPPNLKSGVNWLNSEILSMFHFHMVNAIENSEQINLFTELYPSVYPKLISEICSFSTSLKKSKDENLQALSGCLSTKQVKRLLKLISDDSSIDVRKSVESAFMPQFLPSLPQKAFIEFIQQQNFTTLPKKSGSEKLDSPFLFSKDAEVLEATDESLIPQTLFFENEEQTKILENMKRSFAIGEHLLLVGNQGVGKNKLVDKMLSQLSKPRQYIQLHRDTTVQALTVQPSVKDGKIVYEDSPLIKAVKNGHALVVDEADKAPTHVTSILKGLVEDKFMHLSDGRKIVAKLPEKLDQRCEKIIVCHPNFRMIVLANRPGFPFLGNDFFAAMGDLFSCHAIDNPGKDSQIEMLTRYAPNVDREIVIRLIDAFDELRDLSNQGVLSYPYSTRELVNIVKHLEEFPRDGIPRAIQNIFDFDGFDDQNLTEVNKVLKRNGIPVSTGKAQVHMAKEVPLPDFKKISDIRSDIDNPISATQKIVATNMDFNSTRLSPEMRKMQTYSPRAEFFQEQKKIVSIPIDKSSAICDMKALKIAENMNSPAGVFAVSLFPCKLFFVPTESSVQTLNQTSCSCTDLSKVFDRTSLCTTLQLNFVRAENIGSGNFSVACYAPQNNILLLVDPANNQGKILNLERLTNGGPSNAMSSVFRRGKVSTGSFKMVSSEAVYSKLVFYKPNSEKMLVLDFDLDKILEINVPFEIRNVEFLSEDDLAVYNLENEMIKFSRIPNTRESESSSEEEIFVYKSRNSANDSTLRCSGYFDSSQVSEFLENQNIVTPAKLVTGDRTQVGISLGFPDLDDGEVYGVKRTETLRNSPSSIFLNPSFAAVSLLDTRFIPKQSLPDDIHLADYPMSLEWINVRSKVLRYLPIPTNKYEHAMSRYLAPMNGQNLVISSDGHSYVYTCDPWGTLRQWEVNYDSLRASYQKWVNMIGQQDEPIKIRHSQREATGPKHGKVDAKGDPHVGGNQWAGGSGGADTAGLGGVGGPYRLNLGHQVFQVPDSMKQNVPPHVLKAAKEMRDKAFAERLKEIEMSHFEAETYNSFYESVKQHINSVRVVIDSLEAKQKDREWLKHQTLGELDDTKLVDSLLGEKSVFKRRGEKDPLPGQQQKKPKLLRLLCDVSGSMYRFNIYDQRLQRQLESVCMVMEALKGYESKFKYDIIGHSGEDDSVEIVKLDNAPSNEKERLRVLQTMHAHSQYCLSGDSTVAACSKAVKDLAKMEADERFLILFSDANFSRYGISPSRLAREMLSEKERVNSFVIFIGSLGDEAEMMKSQLPSQSAFVCLDTKDIPAVIRQILTSTMLK